MKAKMKYTTLDMSTQISLRYSVRPKSEPLVHQGYVKSVIKAVISHRSVAATAINQLSAFTSLFASSWVIQVSEACEISHKKRTSNKAILKLTKNFFEKHVVKKWNIQFIFVNKLISRIC